MASLAPISSSRALPTPELNSMPVASPHVDFFTLLEVVSNLIEVIFNALCPR